MRRTLLSALSVTAMLGFAAGTLATAGDEAKAIIAKAIKAHGGEEALTKYKASQSKHKGTRVVGGAGEVEFTQDVSIMLPDKVKDTLRLQIKNRTVTIVTVYNGDSVSIEANGKAVQVTDKFKEAAAESIYRTRVTRLVSLVKDKDYELSLLGEIKVEGKPAVGVRVSSKGHKDVNLFFNKETGMLVKSEHRALDQGGKEVDEEHIILEHQKTQAGIAFPKRILVKRDGETVMQSEVTEAKSFEKLDDSEFQK
jgi:hypothetical protein